ncbi:MAG: hypothetical protein ACK2UR_01660 [Candidatus Promineifilaceae bacterium]|jgi:hypothetical protein
MEDDPIQAELVDALTELMEAAAALPAAGLQQLAGLQEARAKRLQAVESRLAEHLGEDDIRLLKVRQSIQRSAALQSLAGARAQREAVRPKIRPHEWGAFGTVRFKNGKPAAGARVVLFDRDKEGDDFLGDADTDGSGDFAIIYHVRDFSDDPNEKTPDLVLRVLSKRGKPLIETEQSIQAEAGRVELFDISLPVNQLR